MKSRITKKDQCAIPLEGSSIAFGTLKQSLMTDTPLGTIPPGDATTEKAPVQSCPRSCCAAVFHIENKIDTLSLLEARIQQKYGLSPGEMPEIYLRDPSHPAPENFRILCDADYRKYSSWEHDRKGNYWGRKLRERQPVIAPKKRETLNTSDVLKQGRDKKSKKSGNHKRDERSRRYTLRGLTRSFSEISALCAGQESARFSHTGTDATYDPKGNVKSCTETAVCSQKNCCVCGHYYRVPFTGAERRKQEAKNKLPKQGTGSTKKPPILCTKSFASECDHDYHFHDLEQLKRFGVDFTEEDYQKEDEVKDLFGCDGEGCDDPHKEIFPTHLGGDSPIQSDIADDDDTSSEISSSDPCSHIEEVYSEKEDLYPKLVDGSNDILGLAQEHYNKLQVGQGPTPLQDGGSGTVVPMPKSSSAESSSVVSSVPLSVVDRLLVEAKTSNTDLLCETRSVNIFLAAAPTQYQNRWRKFFARFVPFWSNRPISLDSSGPFPASLDDVTESTKTAFNWYWNDFSDRQRVYQPTCRTNVDLMPEVYQSSFVGLIYVQALRLLFTGDPSNRELYHRSLLNPDGAINTAFPAACKYYLSQRKEFEVWCLYSAPDGTPGIVILENTISHFINQRAFEFMRSRHVLPTKKIIPTFRFSGRSLSPSRSGPFFASIQHCASMRLPLSLIGAGVV